MVFKSKKVYHLDKSYQYNTKFLKLQIARELNGILSLLNLNLTSFRARDSNNKLILKYKLNKFVKLP